MDYVAHSYYFNVYRLILAYNYIPLQGTGLLSYGGRFFKIIIEFTYRLIFTSICVGIFVTKFDEHVNFA